MMLRRSRRESHADQVARALISGIAKTVATKVEGLETHNPLANELSVHDLLALLWSVDSNNWPPSCTVPGEQVIWNIIRQAEAAPMHSFGFPHGDERRQGSVKQCSYLLHELEELNFQMPELMHDALKAAAERTPQKKSPINGRF